MEKQKPCHAARDCAIPPRPEGRGFSRNVVSLALNCTMDHIEPAKQSWLEGVLERLGAITEPTGK